MRPTAADLTELVFVADPRLSPQGDVAVATVTHIVPERDDEPPRYRTRIHAFDLTGGGSRLLTSGDGSDAHPRFDATGAKLAFSRKPHAASGDERVAQIFVMPMAGGEAVQVTEREAGVSGFAWHPDGDQIAFASPSRRSRPYEGGAPLRITRGRYKQEGTGLLTDVPHEIGIVSVSRSQAMVDRAQAAADEENRAGTDRSIELPFAPSELAFSSDGATLFALASTTDREHVEHRSNLLAIDLASSETRSLLPEAMHIDTFVLDPESSAIWFVAPVDASAASAPEGLWRLPAPGAEPELTSGDLDVSPSTSGDSRYGSMPTRPVRHGDGWIVALNASGRSNLAHLGPDGAARPLTEGDRAVTAFHCFGETLVFTAEEPHRPGELFARYADGREVRLSSFNDALCEACAFIPASAPVTIEPDGAELTYWRIEPAEPRSDGAIVMQVHGGPAANYGYGFSFEFQLLAAAGYTVVYGNPRGGSSFGRAFATAIQGRYGTIDADDVMAMVEHAVAQHPEPEAPVHLTGGSYGGFMTNWLVGRTHRFRSAVTQRSISNFASFYGTSDIGPWFTEREIGSAPWRDMTNLWDQSPLKHVADIRTPLLILHAEQDHRCPIEQAEQLYAALVRIGEVPTEFVRFPDEGHELSRSGRPDRRIARLEAILDWFSRHA